MWYKQILEVSIRNQKIYSDGEIVAMINAGGIPRDQAITHVYHWHELKQKLMAFIRRRGGTDHDGQDIFHEGIIALDRNVRAGKFRAETNLQGYLYSICRFIWNNRWRKQQKESTREMSVDDGVDAETPETSFFAEEQKVKLREVLNLLDDACQKILTYWKESFSMEEIAQALSLSSPQLAKKYRYRCMKKLMKALDDKPSLMKYLSA